MKGKLVCLSLLLITLCFSGVTKASAIDSTVGDNIDSSVIKEFWIYPDDPYLKTLDFEHQSYFKSVSGFHDSLIDQKYLLPIDSIPTYTEQEIIARIRRLDSLTPLSLIYNKPTSQILDFYLKKRRGMMGRVLGLSELYYPLFEQELIRNEMPVELKHLSVVESALINVIKSRVGATGLWQFMYNTGRYLGMQIDSYVDDRCDPIVSTQMAVKYLKYLHGLYDDWYMALAAYNAGPGNVNKAIRRSGGKMDFWEIYEYLPKETRSYVPAFIAVNYLMNHAVEHNIRPVVAKYKYLDIDTVHVSKAVGFDQISDVLCIPIEELRFLNPQYKQDYIPISSNLSNRHVLALPYHLIGEFVTNEESIYEYDVNWYVDSTLIDSGLVKSDTVHVVKYGESLGVIANKYPVSVEEIKVENGLENNVIQPGQELKISWSAGKEETKEAAAVTNDDEFEYYTIKRGDSLSGIADNYKGVTVKSLMRLNNMGKRDKLFPGKVIKLRVK